LVRGRWIGVGSNAIGELRHTTLYTKRIYRSVKTPRVIIATIERMIRGQIWKTSTVATAHQSDREYARQKRPAQPTMMFDDDAHGPAPVGRNARSRR
jgi:hypothetical protein